MSKKFRDKYSEVKMTVEDMQSTARSESRLTCKDDSLAEQGMKDESDINKIVAKAQQRGFLVDPLQLQGQTAFFGDFTEGCDYEDAMNKVTKVNQEFAQMPSNIRNHFGNDPAKLLDALQDPEQQEKLQEFGLLQKMEEIAEVVQKVEIINPKPTAGEGTPAPVQGE